MPLKVVDAIWFSSPLTVKLSEGDGCLGIVKVFDEITKETKFYIGAGNGRDEGRDAGLILQWGAKFRLPDGFMEPFRPRDDV